jgi:hypothetical protein
VYFLLLLAVSNYGSVSHIHLFWQKSPILLFTIGSRPALRGDPSTFFGVFVTPQFVQALFTVYLLHELNKQQGAGAFRKDPGQNTNASFQIPGGQNAVRAPASGMRSGRGVDWR